MSTPSRLRRWLQARLGNKWPAAVKATDSAATAFLLAFFGVLAEHGITAQSISSGETWKAAAVAGVVAGLNVVKSAVMVMLTGQTALGGLVSNQLRAQRDIRPVKHPVPLKKPRTQPRPVGYTGEHEAPPTNGQGAK